MWPQTPQYGSLWSTGVYVAHYGSLWLQMALIATVGSIKLQRAQMAPKLLNMALNYAY